MNSSPPRILVHEFVSGGGWQEAELHPGLAVEGLAMLQCVLADFQLSGQFHLVTTLDSRLAGFSLGADRIVMLHHENHVHVLADLISQVDAALIIAPESDGILTRLSALVEDAGVALLGTSSRGTAVAGDKWDCFLRFKQTGLPTPDTWRTSRTEAASLVDKLGFPLVVKPIDGIGCEGVSLATDSSSLDLALTLIDSAHKDVLLQRYLAGSHASVSLLASASGVLSLSLNEQTISVGTPFLYEGGVTPLEHPQQGVAMEYARYAASLIPGLKGYFGIDLVLTEDQCYVIEVNPRLTSSYVGLRQVININLAEAIWHACIDDKLPRHVMVTGKYSFSKGDLSDCRNT